MERLTQSEISRGPPWLTINYFTVSELFVFGVFEGSRKLGERVRWTLTGFCFEISLELWSGVPLFSTPQKQQETMLVKPNAKKTHVPNIYWQ